MRTGKITPRSERGVIFFKVVFSGPGILEKEIKRLIHAINYQVCLSTATFELFFKVNKTAFLVLRSLHQNLKPFSPETAALIREFRKKSLKVLKNQASKGRLIISA